MAENTKIEWAHHTFNPWVGCTAISPACDHCYAESWSRRAGSPELWQGERRRTAPANWRQPAKWNAKAAAAGERHRVFCASLADVFDNQADPQWRADLVGVIEDTPSLDWMLLTKRPQNILKMIPPKWDHGLPDNVWVGTTIEDRARLGNLDHLRKVPAAIRFLSIEPLLEDLGTLDLRGIHLVIVGGESGHGARPMDPRWVRSIRDQCLSWGIPFHFKQFGEWAPGSNFPDHIPSATSHNFGDPTRGDLESVWRVGKAKAGRLLDGREHNGMPVSPLAA